LYIICSNYNLVALLSLCLDFWRHCTALSGSSFSMLGVFHLLLLLNTLAPAGLAAPQDSRVSAPSATYTSILAMPRSSRTKVHRNSDGGGAEYECVCGEGFTLNSHLSRHREACAVVEQNAKRAYEQGLRYSHKPRKRIRTQSKSSVASSSRRQSYSSSSRMSIDETERLGENHGSIMMASEVRRSSK
jgi:hypothetical protein